MSEIHTNIAKMSACKPKEVRIEEIFHESIKRLHPAAMIAIAKVREKTEKQRGAGPVMGTVGHQEN